LDKFLAGGVKYFWGWNYQLVDRGENGQVCKELLTKIGQSATSIKLP